MDTLELRLLGGFEVTVDGRPVGADAYAQRRAADLVKLLALARDHRMARDEVVEALWPHLDADAGLANLHKAASYARKALGGKEAIVLRHGLVELSPGAEVVTDVERFEAGDEGAYGGELLPDDRYETWTVEARERLRDRSLDVLRRAGRWGEVLEQDPSDEEAHRALMREQVAAGDVAGAARQFRRLRDELARLGLRPSQQTLDLRRELLRGPPVHAPRLLAAPLVGRDAELAAATEALGETGGPGGTVFVLGDPGIGKTLLVEAVLSAAEGGGRHTLRGQAHDEEGGTPYAPLLEALEPLLLERPDLTAGLDEGMRRVLALLAPAAGGPAAERATRKEVMAAVSALLVAAARERGVVLALEDLHAADDATLLVVHYLARVARREPLLVIAAARHGEARGTLARVRSGLVERRAATEVVLGPLAGESIAAVAERAAGRPLGPRALAAVTSAAAGNPFFAEELAASAAATGDVELPAHVTEVLDARLARLPAAGRALLPVLAVLDDGFTPKEVAEIAGGGGAEAVEDGEAGVAGALDDAAARGVLAVTAGRYRFRHPLLRDAARSRLEPDRLRAAHADAARAFAERAAPPEQVAHHLLEAGRGPEAVPLLRDAARAGADKGAYADARSLVERALEHAGSGDRAELLEMLGDLRHATGDRRATAAYARALELAPDDVAPRLRVKAAAANIAVGAVEAATAELALVPEAAFEDDQVALFTRGMVAWHAGDMAQARRDADRAAEVAARSGGLTERVADLQAMLAHADGTWEEFAAWQLGDTWHVPAVAGHVFDAYLCVTEYVLHAGDPYDRLADFARRLRAQARDAGARRGEAFASTVLGEAALLSGDLEAARAHLTDAALVSREVGAVGGESLARARLGEALHHLGDATGARAHLDEALELAHASSLADHLLFLVHAPLVLVPEDPDEALELVDRAEALLDDRPFCRFCPTGYYVASARVCARAGETDRGWAFLERAQAGAGLWKGSGPWTAALAEARGELLAAEGEQGEADVLLRRAVEGYAASGQRLHERRLRAALA